MCRVQIGGLVDLIMPTDKGLKVLDLLQYAFECNAKYIGSTGYVYEVQSQAVQTELNTVQSKQLRPASTQGNPLLLGNER